MLEAILYGIAISFTVVASLFLIGFGLYYLWKKKKGSYINKRVVIKKGDYKGYKGVIIAPNYFSFGTYYVRLKNLEIKKYQKHEFMIDSAKIISYQSFKKEALKKES